MWSAGTGSEVMQRIAAPMIGGMITAPLLSMLVIPAAYYLMRRRGLARLEEGQPAAGGAPVVQPQQRTP
jgi:Cu(I)/Ag(I) efflux system membrane protein CusA/SilA